MALLRKYIWVLVILGMIFVSVVIGLIFLLINNCLSRKGKHRISQLQRRSDTKVESNKYNERNLDNQVPVLPPRTQFLTAEAQSYENLAEEEHDYEESMDQKPDYVKVEDETEIRHPPPLYAAPDPKMNCGVSVGESYENLAEEEHDYEESTDQQPDYVKVEDETEILHPPPLYAAPDPKMNCGVSVGESYENLAEEEHDYEESTDQQPDYVKVEDETEILHPPPLYAAPDPKMNCGVSEAQSYENLAEEEHDYEESMDQQPDYVKVEDETEIRHPPPLYAAPDPKMNCGVSVGESYENLAEEEHDYEESTDQQSDYVKVEDEEILLPDPADPEADDASSEDYDDIGSEVEDDYDDVA
ncbi:uncharacterized protein scimp [Odontesthes bonariensis]|uniref:uncharacterized protein scimp n=1 Tax=Odontesthes bonariensis TaxID=219752 RepID=UPI003F581230